MAELGEAVLTIRVNSQEAAQQIEAFRGQVVRIFGEIGKSTDGIFNGLEQSARQAGTQVGRALKQSLEASTKNQRLKFENFTEALEFNPKNTIKGLGEYLTALRNLRDESNLSWRSTQLLTDRIGALESALGTAKQTTAQASEAQRQFNAALAKTTTKREAEQARELAAATKSAADAQRSSVNSINAVGKAVQQTTGFIEQQISAYRALGAIASKGIGDIRGTAKVGSNVVKGAVSAGRGLYNLGAEFGVFEEPKTGPIKQAIAQVAERFRFLGEQAKTTRGFILRTFEGGAVGTGVAALAQQLPEITNYLNNLKAASVATSSSFDWLAKVAQAFDRFVPDGPSGGLLGLFAKLGNVAATSASGVTSLADSAIQLGSNLITGPLSGIRELTEVLGQIPPEAQVAVLALAGLSAGVSSEQTVNSINKILDALGDVELQSLEVNTALDRILSKELQSSGLTSQERDQKRRNADVLRERRQAILNARAVEERLSNAPLALPSAELLAQRVGAGIAPQRLTPGVSNVAAAQAVAALKEQVSEAQKLAASERLAQGEQTQLNAALEAGLQVLRTTVDVIGEQVQGYRFQNEQLQDQLQLLNQIRAKEQQRSQEARKNLASAAEDRQRREQERLDRRAALTERRIQEAVKRNETAARASQARERRITDATGSALIGGAFPLLFGQGVGASLGGGIGGALGGALGGQFGFGLSLIGTALGSQLDLASQKLQLLSGALSDPIGKFGELTQAGLISSKSLEKQIQSLIDVGREAEAAAQIQKDLATTYGDLGAARELSSTTDSLTKAWGKLGVALTEFSTGPLNGLLKLLAGRLENDFQRARNVQLEQDLRNAGLGNRADELRRQSTDPILRSDTAQIKQVNDRFANELPAAKQANALLEKARQIRKEILATSLQQISADAGDNKVLQDSLSFDAVRLQLRERIASLQAQNKLFQEDPNAPGVFRLSPEAEKAREDANTQRQRLIAGAKQALVVSERELRNTRQVVGLQGERLTIAQEQQKVDEAQRKFAEADNTFRTRFTGVDPRTLVGDAKDEYETLNRLRATAENDLNRIRLGAYDAIRRAEESIADRRRQVEEQIAIERAAGGGENARLGGIGRGVLNDLASFRQVQIEAARAQLLASQSPTSEPLSESAKDARQQLVLAGEQLKNKLDEAYKSAKDAVQAISRSIEDAVLALQQAQNTSGQGVNEFLSAQQVTDRQQQVAQQQIPVLQRLVDEFARRTGIQPNFQISGTLEQRNATRTRAIAAFRQELRPQDDLQRLRNEYDKAQRDLVTAAQSGDEFKRQIAQNRLDLATGTGDSAAIMKTLATSTIDLTERNKKLEGAIADLSKKNWTVYVNVPGGTATGDVLPPISN